MLEPKTLILVLSLVALPLRPAIQPAEDLERNAQELAKRGEWEKSLPLWKQLISRHPESLSLVFNLALCYYNTGQVQNAITALERLEVQVAADPASLNLLGRLHSQAAKSETALDYFHKAAHLDPANMDYQVDLVTHLIQVSRENEAMEALEVGMSRFPASLRLHYLMGVLQERLGKSEEAARIYQDLIGSKPDFEPPYVALGKLLLQTGLAAEAAKVLEPALDRGLQNPLLIAVYCNALLDAYPGNELPQVENYLSKLVQDSREWEVPHLLLAKYQLELGRAESGLEHLDQILRTQPDHWEALFLSARALKDLGQQNLADIRFSRALLSLKSEGPDKACAGADRAHRLGLVYLEMGDLDQALKHTQRAAEIAPENPRFQLALAHVLLRRSERLEAFDCFQRALELAPSDYVVISRYGLELSRAERYEEALAFLQKALKIRPSYELSMEIAGTLLKIDRRAEAVVYLERAVALAPERAEAYYYLGKNAENLARYDEAAAHFRDALKRDDHHLEALLALGEIEAQGGNIQAAEKCLLQALEIDPSYVTTLFRLGVIKNKTGNSREAVALWLQAVEEDEGHTSSHYQLFQYYLRKGNSSRAEFHLHRFQKLRLQARPQRPVPQQR